MTRGEQPDMDAEREAVFDPMSPLDLDACFLCGRALQSEDKTKEHVFPRWLLEKFNLWDAQLNSLNDTAIPYRQLVIPCCARCNNTFLSRLEERVRAAVDQGYDAFKALDDVLIYQWVLKIMYGLLRRDASLLADRADETAGSIFPAEMLEDFRHTHSMLQTIRFETDFLPAPPWSIFGFQCHTYSDPASNFDFLHGLAGMSVALRMSAVGLVVCLEDQGSQRELHGEFIDQFTEHPLHPVQFREVAAMIFYKQALMNRVPKYMTLLPQNEGDKMQVISMPVQGFSTKPIHDTWSQATYARILSKYLDLPIDDIYRSPDQVMSWIQNPDGTVKVMTADGRLLGGEENN